MAIHRHVALVDVFSVRFMPRLRVICLGHPCNSHFPQCLILGVPSANANETNALDTYDQQFRRDYNAHTLSALCDNCLWDFLLYCYKKVAARSPETGSIILSSFISAGQYIVISNSNHACVGDVGLENGQTTKATFCDSNSQYKEIIYVLRN